MSAAGDYSTPDIPILDPKSKTGEGDPPIFGSWRRLYIFVLAELVALIALFALFTNVYR